MEGARHGLKQDFKSWDALRHGVQFLHPPFNKMGVPETRQDFGTPLKPLINLGVNMFTVFTAYGFIFKLARPPPNCQV